MEAITLEQYQSRVEELGQALLDVLASVSTGDFNAQVDIPEDIGVFADLGVGLEFLIEDLRELVRDQERGRIELEQRVTQRTRELERTLRDLQETQRHLLTEGWQEYVQQDYASLGLVREQGTAQETPDAWLPGMDKAVQYHNTIEESNDNNQRTLALPIRLQDEVIGVLGFNRKGQTSTWSQTEIATVEAIVEQVGLALENQRLFDNTQAALAEADSLYQASAELNTARTYEDILQVIYQFTQLGQLSNNINISLFDVYPSSINDPAEIEIIAHIIDRGQVLLGSSPISEDTINPDLLSSREITFIENVYTDQRLNQAIRKSLVEQANAASAAFIPMVVGGEWIGYIAAYYRERIQVSPDVLRRALAIGTQASVAVQNLRNIQIAEQRAQEAQKRSEELAVVNRVVSSVAATMDITESLSIVADELGRAITNADEIGVGMLNEDKSLLQIVAAFSRIRGAASPIGLELPVQGNHATQQVINTKKPIVVRQVRTNEQTDVIKDIMVERGFETMAIFPLTANNEVIGTIAIAMQEDKEEISADQMRLAETIVLQASTSIQNSRLFLQTQTALDETANLYRASSDLNTVQSYDDILKVLRRYTLLNQGPNHISIMLFDDYWGRDNIPDTITPVAQWTIEGDDHMDKIALPLSVMTEGAELMAADQLILIDDLANDPRLNDFHRDVFLEQHKAVAVLSTPFVSAGRWIGQMFASFDRPVQTTEAETRRLMALAGQAAAAIQNLRLLAETERRAGQLETAAEIAREASGSLDVNFLINRAVNLIRDRFGYYHASIFLKEGNEAVVHASTGEAGRQMVENRHSLPLQEGTSIIGHVSVTGNSLVVNDVTADPTHRPHPLLPDTRGELGIPLKIGNRVIGALDVQSTEVNAFTDDDIAVLQTLVDQIAVGVDNARSFQVAQDAVEEMREIDRLKSEFLANMSHELRTPLNSIIGFSRVILKGIDGPINDMQQQDLQAIHGSGQHLLDMINDILDLSKIEAGKMELSIEEVDLDDIINSVLSTAKGLVKEKPVRLINNAPDILPTVHADRTRVRQILLNLLQNATKFTEEGSIILNVDIYHDEKIGGQMAKVSVTDSGIGISDEDQKKLFMAFSQVDSSLTRKVGGTGLGLSISRHLVEMQGGEINVFSEEGKGSSFYFTLPVATPADAEIDEEILPGSRVVMAIDDDAKVISLYRRYLNAHGFQVVSLTNPVNALEQVKKIKPFAITLDIMMPGKDGWQVIEEIKSDPETSDIPVVICSIVEDKDRGYQLGAKDYLVKPILEDEFVNAIKRLNLNGSKNTHDILIVDDDPNIMQLVERTIQAGDGSLRFHHADSGVKGLVALKKIKPDAVVLDLIMPDLDGYALLETMQADADMKNIPVIILTAADLNPEEKEALQGRIQGFFEKDVFKEDQLVASLERALQNIDKSTKG